MSLLKNFNYKKNINYIVLVVLAILLILALIFTTIFLSDTNKNLDTNTKAATVPSYNLVFNPSLVNPAINEEFAIALDLTTLNNIAVQGYQVSLTFDNTRLQLTNLDYTIGNPAIGLATDNTNLSQVNSPNTAYSGKIRLFAEVQSPNGYPFAAGVTKNLASFKFKYINSGIAQVALVDSKSEFDEIQANGNLNPIKPVLQNVLTVGSITPANQVFVPNSVIITPTNTAIPSTTKIVIVTPKTSGKITITPTPNNTTSAINETAQITTQPSDIIGTLSPFTYTPTPIVTKINNKPLSPVEILIWILIGSIILTFATLGAVILIKRGRNI